MADDIVAELDRWLERNPVNDRVLTLAAMVQRARDEIVALREGVASGGWVWEQLQMTHKAARAEERERCAQIALKRAAEAQGRGEVDDYAARDIADLIGKGEERTIE